MPEDIRRSFGFVNIAAGANRDVQVDVKNTMMVTDYNTGTSAEARERKYIEWHERLLSIIYVQ